MPERHFASSTVTMWPARREMYSFSLSHTHIFMEISKFSLNVIS
jgi:hypothetical protein